MILANIEQLNQFLEETISCEQFIRATFGGPRRGGGNSPWHRVSVRKLGERWQCEYFDERKSFVNNLTDVDLATELNVVLELLFSAIHVTTRLEEIDLRITKKCRILASKSVVAIPSGVVSHNRIKQVPLPEGEVDPLLRVMGILGNDGRVKPTMRGKYTQINEFLKHLLHVFDDTGLRTLGRPIEILDAGCGASYLTLAVHHYLNSRLGIPAHIVGVDINEEMIRKSIDRAGILGAASLKFVCAKIDALDVTPDVVIALHACDTATDAALAAAITRRAKLVLSVPCCHHDLNKQLKAAHAEVLRPILRHGILHERQADLATDAFRALILRLHGYRTDVVEFTSPEHTARNLMIRAVKIGAAEDRQILNEYHAMKRFFGVMPYLETLLPESLFLR